MITTRSFAAIGAITGWFAILSQLAISISARSVSLAEQLFRFIGYFTITTNILVALCFTLYCLPGNSRNDRLMTRPDAVFSIMVFIIMVAIIYNVILRPLGMPSGFPLLVNELLHVVQPLLFVFFWAFFIPKDELRWKTFVPWLFYPIIYILYVVVLGAFTGHYPYPFADVGKLGYNRALFNGLLILGAFLLLAFLLQGLVRLCKARLS
ncbi:hypothetical protein EDD80_101436 [Anseongella ginsenosidimutans]|uniref:FAR-17a/AIG1-like protein n=1 Tax=Anseongella ginsenosidimutans TaxID=496056 RepID=A0A4R3KWQ9_9SPHI|nr:Pr6Pr family membrane protein [Anseongella ginsenosidimutans]QEC51101.1 hypothetical protein FRZ59_01195 [Anseongella ginsenosidimutans]TCS90237.1 hypothetical protein EDD80_101436 [Anseongella ginsenosidimutans]